MSKEESINLLSLLTNLLKTKKINEVSSILNVANGTVKRWLDLEKVPSAYCFDLMKLANIPIDYSKFTSKEKDQFYTPKSTAEYCYKKILELLRQYGDNEYDYVFIEPSAGNGNFLKVLPPTRRIGIDVEPRNDEIIKCDYLTWDPEVENQKYIVLGNPPFGLRGQLALKFINHSQPFADYVCFILPQLFESDGKGVPRKRVIGYNLVHSEKINSVFYDPSKKEVKVECIFQLWSKHHVNPKYIIKTLDDSIIKVYSLSDGGSPSSTRNKKMFYKCHAYLPSTCFGKDNMRYYSSFDELPKRRGYGIVFQKDKEKNINKCKNLKWHNIAFLSTNSAYNLRSSQIISQFD